MIDRMDRIQKMMKNEIAVIIQSEINNPRINSVTITRVEVSRDLREAKVFWRIEADEEHKKGTIKALKSAASFVRGELGHRIEIKFVPKITFVEDRDLERVEEVDRLFEKIEKEHHWESEENIESEEDNGRIE